MSRIFITGGSGFIGTNLIEYLLTQKDDLLNYDIEPPRNHEHDLLWIKGDILNFDLLKSELEKFQPDYVVHLAARTDLHGSDLDDYSSNIDGVGNLIEASKGLHNCKRILFTSSRLVCKIGYQPTSEDDYCPTTFYGKSKVAGEKLVRKRKNEIPSSWLIIRPTSIWGPWFGIPYKNFFESILHSNYIHPAHKRIYKSFGYVKNSAYQIYCLLTSESSLINGKTLYLTDYEPIEVKTWADTIAKSSGKRKPLEVPLFVLRILGFLGDILKKCGWKEPPLTSFRLDNLLTNMLHDTLLLKKVCGELPYSTEEGILDTLEWIETHS